MMYRNTPLTEAEKRRMRHVKQIKQPLSQAQVNHGTVSDVKPVKAVRDYLAPVKPSYVPTVRGRTGCKLNPVVRAMVERKRALNAAFHADLAAFVRG